MKVCPSCGTEYGEEAAFCSRDRSPLRPADAPPSQGLVGSLVGERYQVERRLGEGGMGEVYLARHVLIGRPCALKVMSQALSKDPDAVSRFNREATSASRITHPNVCTVYDFGLTSEGLIYLAMEYVEGRALSAVLDQGGPMPVQRAAALLAQCAAGLMAAHELGIVHRDLKPDNIMVQSGKEREIAKLVDFGIAKAVEGAPGQRVTKTGFVIGTPEYMSPEQLAGDPVEGRSDQYSLALVFYRLITGRLPFEGTSLQETLVQRLTDPPRPLAQSRPEVEFPAGLQAIMDRALARDPEQRYQTVLEFSDAVAAAVAGDAVTTRKLAARRGGELPPTRQTPAARAPRGRRVAAAGVGVLLLAAGGWGVVKLTRGSPTVSGADSVPPAPPPAATPVDSLRGAPLAPSPPAPAPQSETSQLRPQGTPVPAGAESSQASAPGDTAELSLDALESPTLRGPEIQRAQRMLRMPVLSPARRAQAASMLGGLALEAGKSDTARILFRMAWRLDPKPVYRAQLRLVGDTIQ